MIDPQPMYVQNPQSSFEELRWPVADDYELVETELRHIRGRHPLGPQRAIKPRLVDKQGVRGWTFYRPMEKVALDRVIAETEPTEAGVLATARKYGFLGAHMTWQTGFSPSESIVEHRGLRESEYLGYTPPRFVWWSYEMAEPLEYWVYHITKLKTLRRLRELVDAGDGAELKRMYTDRPTVAGDETFFKVGSAALAPVKAVDFWSNGWPADKMPAEGSAPGGYSWVVTELAGGFLRMEMSPYNCALVRQVHMLGPDDLWLEVARFHLSGAITEALNLYAPSVFRYEQPAGSDRKGMSYTPTTLIGVAYAQLAIDLSGQLGGEVTRCPRCGDYFYKVHGRRRVCSNACRVAMHRREKKNNE